MPVEEVLCHKDLCLGDGALGLGLLNLSQKDESDWIKKEDMVDGGTGLESNDLGARFIKDLVKVVDLSDEHRIHFTHSGPPTSPQGVQDLNHHSRNIQAS